MKRLLLLFLFTVFTSLSYATSEKKEISLEVNYGANPTRSLTLLPEVTINSSSLQLSVAFDSPLDSYILYVYNDANELIYQEMIITDGTEYYYQLPALEQGSYSISISNDNIEYIGTFNI
ncbi:MAG: DUF3244 domain-containing protein [Rikenellaceae bacterium]